MEVKWYGRKENGSWVRGMSCEGNEAADGRHKILNVKHGNQLDN